jgi:hemerythrin-like domain-containing protein
MKIDTPTIAQFYSDDHNRLDGLFEQYLKLKEKDPPASIKVLERFKVGLEQHMAWEEAILFSEYDARIPSADEESPTVDLTFEHQQLRDCLEIVVRKMREKDLGLELEKDEARFVELLAAHNFAEETGLYVKLDEVLTNQDRSEIQKRMQDAALT